MRTLKTVKQYAELSPFSEDQLRWMIFNERQNGLFESKAIVRVGRRVYIDVARLDLWIEGQQEARPAAPARPATFLDQAAAR